MATTDRTTIKVALDWTPNTIHTGLYLALSRGLYTAHNLDVHLLPPDEAYTLTPAKRLEKGEVDLAICPSESCIAYAESARTSTGQIKTRKMQLQAIYAILQRDASAIVSTKFDRIGDLGRGEGGTYGSYNARYEDGIVKAMVAKDGGDAAESVMRIERQEGMLSLFSGAMREGRVDATWVFMPWEGVEAELEGVRLHAFRAEEYGVPYGYSPVIARRAEAEEGVMSNEVLGKFVQATAEGYRFAMENVEEAVEVLGKHCVPQRSEQFLMKSQSEINGFYGDGSGELGKMSSQKWKTWLDWLRTKGLLKDGGHVTEDQLFLNP